MRSTYPAVFQKTFWLLQTSKKEFSLSVFFPPHIVWNHSGIEFSAVGARPQALNTAMRWQPENQKWISDEPWPSRDSERGPVFESRSEDCGFKKIINKHEKKEGNTVTHSLVRLTLLGQRCCSLNGHLRPSQRSDTCPDSEDITVQSTHSKGEGKKKNQEMVRIPLCTNLFCLIQFLEFFSTFCLTKLNAC